MLTSGAMPATPALPFRSPRMTAPSLDILGIGNAIVDVIARAEPELLPLGVRSST